MKSNKKRFWSLFKSVSSSSSVPSKTTWKRDDGTVTATNPEETANLLNNYFYSMFNQPLSQEDYDAHPVPNTTSCNPLGDITISPDDLDVFFFLLMTTKLHVQTEFQLHCSNVVLPIYLHRLVISSTKV